MARAPTLRPRRRGTKPKIETCHPRTDLLLSGYLCHPRTWRANKFIRMVHATAVNLRIQQRPWDSGLVMLESPSAMKPVVARTHKNPCGRPTLRIHHPPSAPTEQSPACTRKSLCMQDFPRRRRRLGYPPCPQTTRSQRIRRGPVSAWEKSHKMRKGVIRPAPCSRRMST